MVTFIVIRALMQRLSISVDQLDDILHIAEGLRYNQSFLQSLIEPVAIAYGGLPFALGSSINAIQRMQDRNALLGLYCEKCGRLSCRAALVSNNRSSLDVPPICSDTHLFDRLAIS